MSSEMDYFLIKSGESHYWQRRYLLNVLDTVKMQCNFWTAVVSSDNETTLFGVAGSRYQISPSKLARYFNCIFLFYFKGSGQ